MVICFMFVEQRFLFCWIETIVPPILLINLRTVFVMLWVMALSSIVVMVKWLYVV